MQADIKEEAIFPNYGLPNLLKEDADAAGSDNFTKPRTWPIPMCSVSLNLV